MIGLRLLSTNCLRVGIPSSLLLKWGQLVEWSMLSFCIYIFFSFSLSPQLSNFLTTLSIFLHHHASLYHFLHIITIICFTSYFFLSFCQFSCGLRTAFTPRCRTLSIWSPEKDSITQVATSFKLETDSITHGVTMTLRGDWSINISRSITKW